MAMVDTENLISISEANKLGVAALAREAEQGRERILVRNNKPVAAVVGIERLERLQQLEDLEDDLIDITLATARLLTSSGDRYSLDEVLAMFGYTREQLRDLPDE
jgi:hypothetical protein